MHKRKQIIRKRRSIAIVRDKASMRAFFPNMHSSTYRDFVRDPNYINLSCRKDLLRRQPLNHPLQLHYNKVWQRHNQSNIL